jgi:hypothetical protein
VINIVSASQVDNHDESQTQRRPEIARDDQMHYKNTVKTSRIVTDAQIKQSKMNASKSNLTGSTGPTTNRLPKNKSLQRQKTNDGSIEAIKQDRERKKTPLLFK